MQLDELSPGWIRNVKAIFQNDTNINSSAEK